MRKLRLLAALAAIVAVGCQQENFDVVHNAPSVDNNNQSIVRDYYEALAIAEEAVAMVDNTTTRSSNPRKIMSSSGQIVYKAVTRGGETAEEPIMYVFNNENNEGFTIVAADRSRPALIAATEQGNYTYGEPTGVEPFDLMMEDVVTTLNLFPGTGLAIRTEIINDITTPYGPNGNIKWGNTGVYGSLYPTGEAFFDAVPIAQALVNNNTTLTFTVTIPDHAQFGQTVTMSSNSLKAHINNSHSITGVLPCNAVIHSNIALLYREIGERLSGGKASILNRPDREFPMSKIHEVYESFDSDISDVDVYVDSDYTPQAKSADAYYCDLLIMQGELDDGDSLHNDRFLHTWLVNGLLHRGYDLITYTLNSILNPNHPNPNGYTETNREHINIFWYHINWGFDGNNNGWFDKGCFDMANRDTDHIMVGGHTDVYDYNFTNIEYMVIYE